MECPNRFPNDKILDLSKLKAIADDKITFTEQMKFVLGRVEKNYGKRGKCWLPAFFPLPIKFTKAFFQSVIKSLDCVVKG